MKLIGILAAAAVVACAGIDSSEGARIEAVNSLRASILTSLKTEKRKRRKKGSTEETTEESTANSEDPDGTPPHCKGLVGTPSNQDRYCEATAITTNPDNCGCKEQCHIWGDPHVEPFLTGCDMLTLKAKAWYSFFWTGESRPPAKVQVSGYADELKGPKKGFWVSKLYLESPAGNEMLLTVDECEANPNLRIPRDIEVQPSGYGNKVTIRILAYCDQNGKAPMHVNTYITIIDNCVDETDTSETPDGEVPASAKMFSQGSGICVNPCNNPVMIVGSEDDDKPTSTPDHDMTMDNNGKKECKVGNDWVWEQDYGSKKCVRRPGGIDGRTCSFTAQCSVHGDPYLTDFYQEMLQDNSKMCKTTGGNAQCTQIYPEIPADDATPADQQAAMQTRELYTVPGYFQAEVFTDDCHLITKYIARYKVGKKVYSAEYDAEELCPRTDSSGNTYPAGATGVMFQAPSDQPTGDKKIDKTNKKVYDEYTGGYTLPVVQNDDGSETEAGVVLVNLKCHITNLKDGVYRVYFNACVERYNGQRLEGGDFVFNGDYKTVETSVQSRGWCATGPIVEEQRSIESVEYTWKEITQDQTVTYAEECQLGSTSCGSF